MKAVYAPFLLILAAGCSAASLDYEVLWEFTPRGQPSAMGVTFIALLDQSNVFYAVDNGMHLLEPDGTNIWNYRIRDRIYSAAAGDINSDNITEIVMGSRAGGVYVYGYMGSLLWNLSQGGGPLYVALGDLDDRPGVEVLAAGGFNVTLYSSDGSLVWAFTTSREITTPPVLSDVDLDGRKEVVFGASNLLYVVRAPPYGYSVHESKGGILPSPLVLVVDGVRGEEIIYATADGVLSVLNYSTRLNLEWNYSVVEGILSAPAILDLDGDGILEIAFGSQENLLYILNPRGGRVWRYSTRASVDYQPASGDVDSDGAGEMVYSTDNTVRMLDNSNDTWSHGLKNSISLSPLVFDLTGDGLPEILAAQEDGTLTAFSRRQYVEKSAADRFYEKAEDYYGAGSYFNAIAYVELARQECGRTGDNDGVIRAERMSRRIEADEVYSMGSVYYDFGYYDNAEELSSQSLAVYRSIGFERGIEKALSLKQRAIMHRQADDMLNLSKLDYLEGQYIDSRFEALQASRLYKTINHTAGALDADSIVEKVYGRIHADSYYRLAVLSYFNRTSVEEAKHYLGKARQAYGLINDSSGTEKAVRLATRMTADEMLSNAKSSLASGSNDDALKYASTAEGMYEQLEYEIGALKASEVASEASTLIEEEEKRRTEEAEQAANTKIYLMIAASAVLTVTLLVLAYRKLRPSS